jgi:hypothetical protein
MTDNNNLLIGSTTDVSKHIAEGKHRYNGKFITAEDKVSDNNLPVPE